MPSNIVSALALFTIDRDAELDRQLISQFRPDGTADPEAYATRMTDDRRLRLSDYEVHRFGGYEFIDPATVERVLDEFFIELLAPH